MYYKFIGSAFLLNIMLWLYVLILFTRQLWRWFVSLALEICFAAIVSLVKVIYWKITQSKTTCTNACFLALK